MPSEVFAISAENNQHFFTAFSGRAALSGPYSYNNLYKQLDRFVALKDAFEKGDILPLKTKYNVRYIYVGSQERSSYRLHSVFSRPEWKVFAQNSPAGDLTIYDISLLPTEKLPEPMKLPQFH